jgi:hypothetical protein
MGSKLKDAEIEDLAAWVKSGAVGQPRQKQRKQSADGKFVIHAEARNFWSFQPLKDPAPPAVKDEMGPHGNRQICSGQARSRRPQARAQASKRDLIRRVTLDLTGLPPTFEEIENFEKDTSAEAFAKVVDRLLASPAVRRTLGSRLARRGPLWRG